MKTTLTLICLLGLSATAAAKTDVKGATAQLKVNEENAAANHQQYVENSEIATKNIVEVTTAIKQLREQRTQLLGNAQNLDKNLAILDTMKAKLEGFKQDEVSEQKKEDLQAAQLKSTLEKLEANKIKRAQNVEAYAQKLKDVEAERADWGQQKQAFTSVQKDLDTKEAAATTEREKWIAKRKGYRDESAKWEKESQIASEQRVKYEKLKD